MGHLSEIAPGVLVGTSRFMVTNTTVLTLGGHTLVVDPGVHDDELRAVAAEISDRGLRPEAGFATHSHWDHLLWHDRLPVVPRYASEVTVERARRRRDAIEREAMETTAVDTDLLGDVEPAGDALPWAGPEVTVVTHDAHCAGHSALHVPGAGILVAGDMGSDVEVPLLEHGIPGPAALERYWNGLERLTALAPVDLVVTGHGTACDGRTWRLRLDADRRYLDDLVAGSGGSDQRLLTPWLADADADMRSSLTKSEWRRWAASLPAVIDQAQIRSSIRSHVRLVARSRPRSGALTIGGYDALGDEIDLGPLGDELRSDGHRVVLPRVEDDRLQWHHPSARLERSPHGFGEPAASDPLVAPTDLDLVLVPGRLFDERGIRLGRGGGHYDRLVSQLSPDTELIGIAGDDRVVRRLPAEPHDRPMTHLAIEAGVFPIGTT